MLRVCLGLLSGLLLMHTLPAGEPGFRAELIGGTLPELSGKSTAEVNLGNVRALFVRSGHEEVTIPYDKVNSPGVWTKCQPALRGGSSDFAGASAEQIAETFRDRRLHRQ